MKVRIFLIVIIFLAVFTAILSMGQTVPQLINFQGKLTDSEGQPLDGTSVDMVFTFYEISDGGTVMLEVLQNGIQVTGGLYNVLIGSGAVNPGTAKSLDEVFQKNKDVWMGVKVQGDDEMTPRSRITSVPFAMSFDLRFLEIFNHTPDWDQDGHQKDCCFGGDDCNDADPAIYTGAPDTIVDGIDQNCDGVDGPISCTEPGECTSGFCTDGYCCDTLCGETCRACDVPGLSGVCSPIPYGQDPDNDCPDDALCVTACDGSGICQLVDDLCSSGVGVGYCLQCGYYNLFGYCYDSYNFNYCKVAPFLQYDCSPYICNEIGCPFDCCGYNCYSDAECCTSQGFHCNTDTNRCE